MTKRTARGRNAAPLKLSPRTIAVRGGLNRSAFGETAEALYLTSGFSFDSAAEAERVTVTSALDGFTYTRFGNPTVEMFEERLRLIEGAEACRATATGMSAMFTAMVSLLRAGDRVVASRALFGGCHYVVTDFLPRFGVTTELVDPGDIGQWQRALSKPAKAVFFETPANPMLDLVDVKAVCDLAHAAGARVVVDNVFATPLLQKPLQMGADVVIYSTTKHIDGQGRTMGGAILGAKDYVEKELLPVLRNTGPVLSPFNAWVMLKGLETLDMRVEAASRNAAAIAAFLDGHEKIALTRYPFLKSHPQQALARRQMGSGGAMVAFAVKGAKAEAFRFLDALQVIDVSNNLGDAKSLACHPATTTHYRVPAEERARLGVTDAAIRLSVGIEDVEDLMADLEQALAAV
ncbi:MAG: O-succinylhomoserine sulfhydrylase [Alphaproteobacteria bacterium]|nr:O-succinylhomoserine sulfhydrylase [Alphaproteobacteria bacterium]